MTRTPLEELMDAEPLWLLVDDRQGECSRARGYPLIGVVFEIRQDCQPNRVVHSSGYPEYRFQRITLKAIDTLTFTAGERDW